MAQDQVTLTGPTTVDIGALQSIVDFIDRNSTDVLIVLIIAGLTTAVVWLAIALFKSKHKDKDEDYLTRKDFESFKEHHNARYREFKKENHDEHEGLEKKMDSQYNKIMEKLSELGEKIAELKGKVEK